MNKRNGRLIVISAPSGTGKSTIINNIKQLRPDLEFSISATTRNPRNDEIHGESYYFVSRERFQEMIDQGELLEYACYVGEYYGTPKRPIYDHIEKGLDIILEIEVHGASQVRALDFDIITIFIVLPDKEELERRLRGRGTDSETNLQARLEQARLELEEQHHFSHVVVNDNHIRAAEEILSIIDRE